MELFRRQESLKPRPRLKLQLLLILLRISPFAVAAFDPASRCERIVDTAEYESCLLNLAEARLADMCSPPASKAACISRGESGTIYVKHMRKSGGTSVKGIIKQRLCARMQAGCPSHAITAFADEMRIFDDKHPFISAQAARLSAPQNQSAAAASSSSPPSDLFALTILREPLSRIVSSYHFEGSRKGGYKNVKRGVGRYFSFAEYVSDARAQEQKETLSRYANPNIWNSISDYYTRQLSGRSRRDRTSEEDYRKAIWRLTTLFDIVLITERMNETSTQHLARATLPALPTTAGRLPVYDCPQSDDVIRSEPEEEWPSSYRALVATTFPHANPNRKNNRSEILFRENPEVIAELTELNKYDLQLYAFAKRLSELQADGWKRAFALSGEGKCSPVCERPLSAPSKGAVEILPNGMRMRIPPFTNKPEKAPLFGCSASSRRNSKKNETPAVSRVLI